MAWFTKDVQDFFAELELNNDREWFAANKKRYEASVKEPMLAFAAEMITRMQEVDPGIAILPKDAVFRIYRDVRFSKEKAPYKTNASMMVSRGGRGDHATPGLYFHLDAEKMAIATGLYMLEPARIHAVRSHIAANLEEFASLLADPEFKNRFGTIAGEKNKILPPEFRQAAAQQPLIFNKQFFYWAEHASREALRDDLPDFVMAHIRAAQPMNRFLGQAL
jgi:uncharacterized protein (TIGR02453 family)